ncbi:hypothetical protein Thiosp_00388 [Thiorhodovibrio litoralis]|jgi:hypothetical protein|nr:hypothetical protein [Thiorhodovibrio winogradskyi]WPL10671.1 hypothetical protein Thiosp_00388 [Thiorhodovibrio litoralis]
MARLTADDRAAFRRLTNKGWVQSLDERSPRVVKPTTEARYRYCLWATAAAKFFRGKKPVRFGGEHWKL